MQIQDNERRIICDELSLLGSKLWCCRSIEEVNKISLSCCFDCCFQWFVGFFKRLTKVVDRPSPQQFTLLLKPYLSTSQHFWTAFSALFQYLHALLDRQILTLQTKCHSYSLIAIALSKCFRKCCKRRLYYQYIQFQDQPKVLKHILPQV